MIYLDYAANTPVNEEVLSAFCRVARQYQGNANSRHEEGWAAKAEMERSTVAVAALLGVKPSEIIFTSGATEANNTAIKGIAKAMQGVGKHILSTPLEHSSVTGCLQALQKQGYEVEYLSLQADGKINLHDLETKLRNDTVLVAVCAVDSELGTIQPLAEIAAVLQNYPNCHLHVDATQAVGKVAFPLQGIDTMSFAPHKFYGLCGSGILFKRKNVELVPLLEGGASTTSYRSGTPALALAAGTETALRLAVESRHNWWEIVVQRHTLLREQLSHYPKVHINSPIHGSPYILNLSVAGVRGQNFQSLLNEFGICVSVKSACSSDGQPSQAVLALTHDYWNALSSWRLSLSHLTTEAEVQEFLVAFAKCYKKLTTQ